MRVFASSRCLLVAYQETQWAVGLCGFRCVARFTTGVHWKGRRRRPLFLCRGFLPRTRTESTDTSRQLRREVKGRSCAGEHIGVHRGGRPLVGVGSDGCRQESVEGMQGRQAKRRTLSVLAILDQGES